MSEPKKLNVGLSLEKDMIFKCELGEMKVKDCYIDEEHDIEAAMWGPNPSRMLGMAILGCLSASFISSLNSLYILSIAERIAAFISLPAFITLLLLIKAVSWLPIIRWTRSGNSSLYLITSNSS